MQSKIRLAAVLIPALAAGGCVSENPFSESSEGSLHLSVSLNERLTRAAVDPDVEMQLAESCVVSLSGKEGLLYRWTGLDKVPVNLPLKYGSYTAEAWAGDSVSASFDSKFYKAVPTVFSIDAGAKNVPLVCNIANVVVSVNPESVNPEYIAECSVTVSHTRASLEFTSEDLSPKGYFMMPWHRGDDGKDAPESQLEYTVTGKTPQGKDFSKTGVIPGVKAAHEYILNFKVESVSSTDGGAFISLVVDEHEITVDSEIVIKGRPSVSGENFDLAEQIVSYDRTFDDVKLKVAAYDGLKELWLNMSGNLKDLLPNTDGQLNLITMTQTAKEALDAKGIKFYQGITSVSGVEKYYLEIPASFLNGLAESNTAYEFTLEVEDVNGKHGSGTLSAANTKAALKLPPPVVPSVPAGDEMAVLSTSATLQLELSDDVEDPYVRYREYGAEEWQRAPVTRAVMSITLTGLKPGTRYEFQGVGTLDGNEVSTKSAFFNTESTYVIPGGSFEEWSTYSAKTMLGTKTVILPGNTGDKTTSFWGSGNEGSATANMTLTDKSTDMKHDGQYSARLESKDAVGVIAAGNIFMGQYVKTDGTNGILQVGRPYDGSHPSALKFWANYRPASGVKVSDGNGDNVPEGFAGGNDHGQVYVALTTEAVELRTNPKDRKLFSEDDPVVVAYGQVTWTGNFGPDGQLQEVVVNLKYKDNARTLKPTHLVIVASASKYGDFFSGAKGSVMYLDDFQLEY